MKTRKALSLFFCTVAFAAGAATVSVDTAKLAAGSWALSDASLGVPHGRTVSSATAYDVDGTIGFYAIALEGGGTLFLAADDEIGPVLAFTASSDPDLSQGSYLRTMLEKDIAARRGILAMSAASQSKLVTSSGTAVSASEPVVTPAKKIWSALVPSPILANPKLTMASANPRATGAISDMRVEPLVESQWSQQTAGGEYCYNYYTPDHDPCGCTATAAAQIMRYFQYPDHVLDPITRKCSVNGSTTFLTSVGDSRSYDWANMKLIPKDGASLAERRAIGRLTYDVGVAVYSSYTPSGTGADPQYLGELYQEAFDYASGVTYWNETGWNTGKGGLHTREMRDKIIYANLDAGRPVQLAIYFSGHSVVCDGYGFVTIGGEETEFAHINMGWGGTDDMWYNIPEINAANSGAHAGDSGMVFQYMGGAQFNIHPTKTGDLLTGRVVEDGTPVAGAEVVAYQSGSSTPLDYTTTDVHGIYSFALPGNETYDVKAASADGRKTGSKNGIYLQATVEDSDFYSVYPHNVTEESRVGNSWGNDIDITIPHVKVIVGSETNLYHNLNTALVDASAMENPVVEIFGPTKLKAPVTITTNVTIRAVPAPSADDPDPTLDDCAVTILDAAVSRDGWALQVADGVRVDFSNVVFMAESGTSPVVDVMASGAVSVAGKIGIGTVVTRTEDAFVLAGAFELVGAGGLAVAYADAKDRFSQFGVYECSDADAASCAKLILDALDPALTGATGDGGTLVWDRVSIDPTRAIAYATNDAIGVTHYLSIDLLFQDYTNGAEIVFLKDCPADMFTNAVVLADSVTIRSEAGTPVVVTLGKDAGFTVQGEDTELVFTNVVFTRSEASSVDFVRVKDGASFTLADHAAIVDLKLAGYKIGSVKTGAVALYVENGLATMREDSAITNCTASSGHEGKGAAVYLKGANCTFDFAGGLITGCKAGYSSGGGAVYADMMATVKVSGSATAYGNMSATNVRNVYVPGYDKLILSGGLSGDEIGIYCYGGTASGKSFAKVGDVGSTGLVSEHFRNDSNAKLVAELSDDGATLVWAAEPPGPKSVPENEAEARIFVGDSTAAYATVGNAFEAAALHNAESIELLKDASLSNSVSVSSAIVLDGGGYTLSRAGDFCISATNADVSLSVTNIVIDGGMGDGRMLSVVGGSLCLEAGTAVQNVRGSTKEMVAPIVVWDGSLVVNPGVEIFDCFNSYKPSPGGSLTAGAIVVNGPSAHAEFLGGRITRCTGARAGGVTIANGAEARVSGALTINGNTELVSSANCNLVVQDKSRLVLAGILTGRVGYTEGVGGDTNIFGSVASDFLASTTASNLVVSARRFRHDMTDAKGMVATNETEALLVWSSAVGDSAEFTNVVENVTNVYDVVIVAVDEDDDPEIVECVPFAFAAIEETSPGKWKLTLNPGTEHCVYTLKYSSDLETWTAIGSSKELSSGDISGAELEFFFEVDDTDGKKFWKVEGANGIK